MPHAAPLVLVTRPAADAAATCAVLAARGIAALPAPALEITVRTATLGDPGQVQAILMTSRNAVAPVADAGPDWQARPVIAVGAATAAAARAAGFARVEAADGDAEALAARVAGTLDPSRGPLLLAVGEGYGSPLARQLRAQGFRVRRRIVYTATLSDHLPEPAVAALAAGQVTHAVFLSARTARGFLRLARHHGVAAGLRGTLALVISPAVAAVCGSGWGGLRVARRPEEAAVLELIEGHA